MLRLNLKKFPIEVKTKAQDLFVWAKVSKKHQLIVAGVCLLLITSTAGIVYAILNYASEAQDSSNTTREKVKRVLNIESNIPGIVMIGFPHCDSVTLNKTTPYNCELEENQNETVIIAPAEAIKDEKTYVFQTWEGCSEGNTDWKICKKVLANNKTGKITATYGLKNSLASPGNTSTPSMDSTGQTYVPYKPNHTQCKDSTVLNVSANTGTCTVKINSGMRLFMGIDWSPLPGTDEPRVSIICNPAGGGDCTWSAYRNSSLKQTTFPQATPYIINDEYQMGANALNSHMDVSALRTSSSEILYNNWNITFPINYNSGGQNFIFDSSGGYDNWSGHGTLHDYYVTLKYKKIN